MAIIIEQADLPNRNMLHPAGPTDDVIFRNRFLGDRVVSRSKTDSGNLIKEPLRGFLVNLGFEFGEFTGNTIDRMVSLGRVRIRVSGRVNGGVFSSSGLRTEVAFRRDPSGVLLPQTTLLPFWKQQGERVKMLNQILGVPTRIRVRDMTARDLVELDCIFWERWGRGLMSDEVSAISISLEGMKRVCVGRYGGSREVTIHAVFPQKGYKDVMAAFALEGVRTKAGTPL